MGSGTGVVDGGVSAGVVGAVGVGVSLDEKKLPFVAKAIPPMVTTMTHKITK